MQVRSFLGARGCFVAMFMIALAVLANPAPGPADTPDARFDIAVVWDNHSAGARHAAHDGAVDRSCHPDPTCSPAAILMTRPIFEAQGFQATRHPIAETTIRGRNAPVDLPPPRPWAVSRPYTPKYPQT